MSNFLKIILFFIFITNCSLHKNSKFWSQEEIVKEIQENVTELFIKEDNLGSEFNPNLKISLYSKPIDKSFLNNYDNNNGRIDFNGDLRSISKYKFSKIENFHQYDPKISFYKNLSPAIFIDSIIRFGNNSQVPTISSRAVRTSSIHCFSSSSLVCSSPEYNLYRYSPL